MGGLAGIGDEQLQRLSDAVRAFDAQMRASLPALDATEEPQDAPKVLRAARLLFGRTGAFGSVQSPDGRRFRSDAAAKWQPWQQEWRDVVFIGAAVGLFAAFLCAHSNLGPGKESLGFALSTVSLLFLVTGSKIPVTHHISLTASLALVHGGGVLTAAVVGVIGSLLCEAARVCSSSTATRTSIRRRWPLPSSPPS